VLANPRVLKVVAKGFETIHLQRDLNLYIVNALVSGDRIEASDPIDFRQ
jgi:hypothetical protein